jgi:predicted transposase/invertase (TIGR01784 family)
VPAELLENSLTKKAVSFIEEFMYSDDERYFYENVWDAVMKERTLLYEALEKGREEGREEGHEKGLKQGFEKGHEKGREEGRVEGHEKGHEEGRVEERKEIIKKLLSGGIPLDKVAEITGLSTQEIVKITKT